MGNDDITNVERDYASLGFFFCFVFFSVKWFIYIRLTMKNLRSSLSILRMYRNRFL